MTAMESKARAIFRDALLLHYIDGIAAGDKVESWLRKHGGWFPDRQENYADEEATLVDEGPDVSSPNPAGAIDDAAVLMKCLLETLNDESIGQLSLAGVRDWLEHARNLPCVSRDRSRSPRASVVQSSEARSPQGPMDTTLKHKMTMKDIKIAGLQALCNCKDDMIAMKDIKVAALQTQCDCKDGMINILKGQIDFLEAEKKKKDIEIEELRAQSHSKDSLISELKLKETLATLR